MTDAHRPQSDCDDPRQGASRIPPNQQHATAPSEKKIAERYNDYVRKNRERFIYRPFRRFFWQPIKLFIAFLDGHGGAITAAATAVIACLTISLSHDSARQADSASAQFRVMRDQLAEMKSQRLVTIAQTRANIIRSDLHRIQVIHTVDGQPAVVGWELSPHWQNVGSTNATDFFGWYDIDVLDGNFDANALAQSHCPEPAKPAGLPNPSIVGGQGAQIAQVSRFISRDDAIAANTLKKFIFVVGHIEYRDIYYPETSTHHDDWCVRLLPNNVEQDIWSPFNISEKVD